MQMDELHVVPDTRTGTWRVQDPEDGATRSEHTSATEAEVAARAHADDSGVDRVVVHDRYARTRELIRRGRAWLQRRR
jgi:hypothetical protein